MAHAARAKGKGEQPMADAKPEATGGGEPPVVVKKYANRRLYNTESSSYVTLEDLAAMVRQGRDFVVFDAKSGEDITRGVLTQIIVEQEGKGVNLLPTQFLRQLIGIYGGPVESLVPHYLEGAMAAFARQQEQLRRAMQDSMGALPAPLAELGKQNMAMFERAMSLFSPFARGEGEDVASLKAEVARLKAELAEAQRRA
jgi:polyhydroxyalkanoate synthesis repressor PhaR